MKEKIIDKIFRDRLSSSLLVITFAICFFSVYNFSDLLGKYQLQKEKNNKYLNVFNGDLEYNIESIKDNDLTYFKITINKSDIWQMIKGIEISNAYRKKISVYTYLEDGYTGISTVFDFSNEYTEEIECYFDNRKGVPGVYISKGVLKYVSNEGGKKYIHFNGNKYLVKAVYKDYTLDQNDYRIVIPWNLLNKNEKNYYVNLFVSKIEKLELISLDLESNEDITNDIQLIKNFTEKNNLIINGNVSSEDASSILTQGIILIVMVIFAVINAFTVTGMWIVRRREELMIKKAWGMSEGMIYIRTFLELSRHLIASIPVMIIFQILYMLIFKESVTFNLYKYAYLILGIIIILLLVSYGALLRIRKLKPAEGLRGE